MENNDKRIKLYGHKKNAFIRNYFLILAILSVIVIFTSINTKFISIQNILTLIKQASIVGLLALGLNMIVNIGGFDLSFASIANLVSVVMITIVMGGFENIFILSLIGISIGILLSFINSIFIVYIGVPAFIVTLGMQSLATAVSLSLTKGIIIYPVNLPSGFDFLGRYNILNLIPVSIITYFIIATIILILIEYTPFGRKIYSVGSNPVASNHVGIKVKSTKIKAFLISGILYGIAGVLMSSLFGSAGPKMGDAYLMPAIISVFLGSVFLSIGHPNIIGTIVSVFLLVILINGFAMINLPFYFRTAIEGFVLILAVGYQYFGKSELKLWIAYRVKKK